jgi:GT2 family glycosyltransferase
MDNVQKLNYCTNVIMFHKNCLSHKSSNDKTYRLHEDL